MAIQTSDQANAYALRMYNEDYWEKKYYPNIDGLIKIEHPDDFLEIEYRYLLPVNMTLERLYVGENDDLEYPDGIQDELAEDDQGKISIIFNIAIDAPFGATDSADIDSSDLVGQIESCVNYLNDGTMDGGITLSRKATQHIMYRLSDQDMISDTFHQNKGLLSAIQSKIRNEL